jgi:hypothetical protein
LAWLLDLSTLVTLLSEEPAGSEKKCNDAAKGLSNVRCV